MTVHADAVVHRNVTCPFCGLACDDLVISASGARVALEDRGCSRAAAALAELSAAGAPAARVGGRDTPLEEAIDRAAGLLARAHQPVLGGMAADVRGTRALLDLADRCGAVVDHANSAAKLRNLLAVQDGGTITTTLAEVRNRADLVVLVGTDAVSRFPRFFERLVWASESMFGLSSASRRIVYVGEARDTTPGVAPDGRVPLHLACSNRALPDVLAALRARFAGRRLDAAAVAGVPVAQLDALVEAVRTASYAVFVWVAPELDHPHAELTVQSVVELVKSANAEGRAAGLPLGGSDGDITMNQVHTWQTGYPFRTSLATGHPEYDPRLHGLDALLSSGAADMLLWVSSFSPARTPPDARIPRVVLGHAAMRLALEPEVFIPVATPGVDHTGHFFRTDKVVALPLKALRTSRLPSVADVARGIASRLTDFDRC